MTWRTVLPAALFCFSAHLCADPQEMNLREFIALKDSDSVTDLPAEGWIIKIEAGTRLPVKFSVSGPLFSIEEGFASATFVAHEPLFMKIIPEAEESECTACGGEEKEDSPTLLFSQDQLSWMSFDEFFSGNLNAAIVNDELTSEPAAHLSLDIQREQ